MKDLDSIVDEFVSQYCSPTEEERVLVKTEYARLRYMLPGGTFQSGSYARFTATTPLNDLDVVWVIPASTRARLEEKSLTMIDALSGLKEKLQEEYRIAGRRVTITVQTHSVMIEFQDLDGDFSIDIVPAYELSEKNEFGDPFYQIPEVGLLGQMQRKLYYESQDVVSSPKIRTPTK